MADLKYTYTGYSALGYADFIDTATDKMLLVEPGGSYGIRAVDGVSPVPPADGRWDPPWVPPVPPESAEGSEEDTGRPPAPPKVPAVPPVPPLGAEEVTA